MLETLQLRAVAEGDFTLNVDRDGLVIYFRINGKKFLFHGHVGVVLDDLPDYALAVYDTLLLPEEERDARWTEVVDEFGEDAQDLIHDLAHMQAGDHVSLEPEDRQTGFVGQGIPGIFNTYLSQTCNLACTYCFNQGGTFGKPASVMSLETAKETLKFIEKAVRSEAYPVFTVNLFGGEPTLAKEAVHYLARGLQDINAEGLKTRIHIMLSTNGTIYDEELYKILAEDPACNTVVVSLDAFKDTHDENRPFANGRHESSYDVVVSNLKKMVAAGYPVSVVCVVPFPYDFVSAAKELHEFGIPIVEIKQLNHHIQGKDVLPEVFKRHFDTWRDNYVAYSDYYVDYLSSPEAARHVDRLGMFAYYHKGLHTSRRNKLTLACGVADTKVGIRANGQIAPCEAFLGHEQFDLGNVRDGFDPERVRGFEGWVLEQGQYRVDNEQCRKCFAKLVCGGGCYAESYDKSGKLAPLDEAACTYIRETAKIDLYYMSEVKNRHPELHDAFTSQL